MNERLPRAGRFCRWTRSIQWTHIIVWRGSCVEQGDVQAARRHVLMALEEAPRYRDAQKLLLQIVDGINVDASNGTPAESVEEVAP